MPSVKTPEQPIVRTPIPASGGGVPGRPAVLLASRSPRRRQLLSEFGIEHVCAEPLFDDALLTPGRVAPHQWVTALAYLKAWACRLQRLGDSSFVIGADTACVKQGHLIGTPRDRAEAEAIIRFLSGGSHRVITGVAILSPDGTRDLWADDAVVHVGSLTAAQINAYLESELWHGKAGAYNLRERIEAGWPITYQGDPSAIMGLPMARLIPALRSLGCIPEASNARVERASP